MRNRGLISRDGYMLISMQQACRRPLSFCKPNDNLGQIAQIMTDADFGFCMIQEHNKLAGVITQTDLTGFLRDKLLVDKTIKNFQKN